MPSVLPSTPERALQARSQGTCISRGAVGLGRALASSRQLSASKNKSTAGGRMRAAWVKSHATTLTGQCGTAPCACIKKTAHRCRWAASAPSEGERLLRRGWRRSGRSYRLVRRRSSRWRGSCLPLHPRCVLCHSLPGTISWPESNAEREDGGDNNAADDHAGGGGRMASRWALGASARRPACTRVGNDEILIGSPHACREDPQGYAHVKSAI